MSFRCVVKFEGLKGPMWQMREENKKWMHIVKQRHNFYWRKLPDGPWHGAGYDEA